MALQKGSFSTIIMDITRQDGHRDSVNYSTIETLKSQVGFVALYDPRMVVFPPLHVICFSNFLPTLSQGGLSRDRVIIRDLLKPFKSISDTTPDHFEIFDRPPPRCITCSQWQSECLCFVDFIL
uniref:Uncharacterized protein n=1 Tax=Antarctic circular DNA molecule TaxID=2664238 RepID=A0A5Q2F3C6_9ZZZZ|nr:hypothetical protein [Antarctic circular DNA molecule]